MRAARLAGAGSARKSEASWAVGRVPMMSRKARRRKTASEERLAGCMSRRFRRSKTRASMGDWADRGAALSKVGLSARSEAAAVTARQIANREDRIWMVESSTDRTRGVGRSSGGGPAGSWRWGASGFIGAAWQKKWVRLVNSTFGRAREREDANLRG